MSEFIRTRRQHPITYAHELLILHGRYDTSGLCGVHLTDTCQAQRYEMCKGRPKRMKAILSAACIYAMNAPNQAWIRWVGEMGTLKVPASLFHLTASPRPLDVR